MTNIKQAYTPRKIVDSSNVFTNGCYSILCKQ